MQKLREKNKGDSPVIPETENLEKVKGKVGHPKKDNTYRWWTDPKIMAQVEMAFKIGTTDQEACLSAGITVDQLQYYQREVNPDFKLKKELWKTNPILKARANIIETLNKKETPIFDRKGNPIIEGDGVLKIENQEDRRNRIEASKWYLERKKKDEFSTRAELAGVKDQPLVDMADPQIVRTLLKTAKAYQNATTGDPTPAHKG